MNGKAMRSSHAAAPATALALALALSGCRTPQPKPAPAPDTASPPAEALALYGRALLHEFRGEYKEATELLAAAIAADPDDERLNVRTAMLLLRQRRADEALALIQRWLARRPSDPLRLRWLARAQMGADRLDEAAATYAKAIAADPSNAESAAELAALLIRRDAGVEAVAALAAAAPTARPVLPLLRAANDAITWAEARDSAPARAALLALLAGLGARAETDPESLLALGNAYRRLNRPEEAGAAFERAAALAPGDERAALMAALMLAARDREAEAMEMAEQAVQRVRQPLDLLRLVADLRARAAARAGDPEEARRHRQLAIAALRRVLAARPGDHALRMALGDLLILTDQPEEALREFRRVEAADPDMKRRLALRFIAAGDVPTAIARLEALAAAEPRNSQIHHYLGELYALQKARDKAARAFRAAIAGDAPEATAFVRLAGLLAAEDSAAALETLRDGQRRFPADLRIAEARAQIHLFRREFAEALAVAEWIENQVAAEDPDTVSPALWVRSAYVFTQAGRVEAAVERLDRAMKAEPLAVELFVRLAAAPPADAEDHDRARNVLDALDAARKEVLTAMYSGLFEHFVKRHAAAVRRFDEALERAQRQPDSAELLTSSFYFWFGAALERDGNMDRAAEMLLKAIELDPDHHEAQNYLAYSWADRGLQLDRALDLVRRALEKDPENAAYIDTLGWIYFRQGRFEEALAELRRAAEIEPEEPEILDHYGDALHALGRTEEALPQWKRAFARQPDSAAIREKLLRHGVDLAPLEREAEALKAERERMIRQARFEDVEEADEPPPLPGLDLQPEDLDRLDEPGAAP